MPVIDVIQKNLRICDRPDGHRHCEKCDACPRIEKRAIHIVIKDGIEYHVCYKCKRTIK